MRDPTWLLVGRNAEWWWQAARQHHVRFDSATVCCILMGLSANFAFRVFQESQLIPLRASQVFQRSPGRVALELQPQLLDNLQRHQRLRGPSRQALGTYARKSHLREPRVRLR